MRTEALHTELSTLLQTEGRFASGKKWYYHNFESGNICVMSTEEEFFAFEECLLWQEIIHNDTIILNMAETDLLMAKYGELIVYRIEGRKNEAVNKMADLIPNSFSYSIPASQFVILKLDYSAVLQ